MSGSTFLSGSPFGQGDDATGGAERRFESAGADPDQASAVYSQAYGGGTFRVAPLAQGFSYRYAYRGSDRVTLRTSDCAGGLVGEVPHLREYVVGWFRAGGGRLTLRPFTRTGASAPFLLPAERQFGLDFQPHRQSLVHFAPGFLEDVATESHAGPRQPVSFDHEADADPGMLARWRVAVTEASAALATAALAPLVRFTAELNLARALLQLFPWRAWDVPAVLRRPSAFRTRVALDFLQHHAHEPITPADAARAAGLHTRTLQQATQRHLGISPSVYLRDVRLDRAHHDLVAGDPCSTTVAAVAREWGFGNLGRFASAYQARFDELPSHTLRR